MKSSLKTLSRIQKVAIDEQRKLLVEQLEIEEKLNNAIKQLEQELENEKKFSTENPEVGDFGAYFKRYQKMRQQLDDALAQTEKRIEELRDIISDMFKTQKTYDIVDERRIQRLQKEDADKEQKMLDEIGTNNYITTHKGKS